MDPIKATDDGAESPAKVTENDDGSVTVGLPDPPGDLPEEAINLIPHISGSEEGKKFLKEMGEKILEDFTEDWDSCEQWRNKRLARWKLLVGDLDAKSYPFADCANIHIPVMLERVLRIVHRLYTEMFPDRDVVFTALPSTQLSQDRADILTLHGNWQIRKEQTDFFKQNRRGLMEYVANGDAIFHSSRDIEGRRNKHECLSCEEVVFTYHWKTSQIDMSDVPRKTRVLRKTKNELLALEKKGIYTGFKVLFDKDKEASFQDGPDLTVRPKVDKFEGKDPPVKSKVAPHTILEYHGWWKLPEQEEERPIVAAVHYKSKTVVGLYIREQEDWKDRARFEAQMQEMGEFQQAQQAAQQNAMMEEQATKRLQMPDVPPEEAQMIQQTLLQTKPPPPQAPSWLKPGVTGPQPARMVPIEYFSHGVCIENLDGSLGLGLGLLLEPFNAVANTAGSQFTDSATIANVVTAIMPDNVQMEPGDTRLTPGEVHRIRGVSPEQLNNAIKIIQFPPANPQLMEIVRLMLESADGVASAPDVLSGEAGKANETYRGLATRVEQATKQLTVLALNYLELLTNVLRNNARLNAVFMDDVELKRIVDPRTLQSQEIEVTRKLYLEDFEIVFTADTRFGGREQKIAEADQLVGMVTALPPPIAMQMFPPSFIYEAVVRALKARGYHDMVRYLGPRPPTPAEQPMPMGPPGGPPPGPPGAAPPGPPQGAPAGPPNGSQQPPAQPSAPQ